MYYILNKCHILIYQTKHSDTMTEWKEVDGYPNFKISNEGHVKFKGDNDNPEIDWLIWNNGRTALRDIHDRLSKPMSIHRLVAEHFVECTLTDKPRDSYYVKHIDGDITNNRADNLYWALSPHGFIPQKPRLQRQLRQPTTTVSIRHREHRQTIAVYTLHNGKKQEKEFRYLKIGKDNAMEKANEYVKKFKEEHGIS